MGSVFIAISVTVVVKRALVCPAGVSRISLATTTITGRARDLVSAVVAGGKVTDGYLSLAV